MDWQLAIALLCVAFAAGFLVRRGVQLLRNRSRGCGSGSCGGCPSGAPRSGKAFVSLGSLKTAPPRK